VAQSDEKFLARWSRLKREEAKPQVPEKTEEAAPPALPPVEKLTPESDFSGFMHPKVEDALRRVALKKLFSDPHFTLPDPYEPYPGDWTIGQPTPDEMLKTLNQARTLLFPEDEKKQPEPPQDEEQKPQDEPGRQDA